MIHIGDPIAAYLAFYPEEILDATPVELEVGTYIEGVDMYAPEAKNYLKVKKVDSSNVVVVRSVKDPERMRKKIFELVSRSFDWKKF